MIVQETTMAGDARSLYAEYAATAETEFPRLRSGEFPARFDGWWILPFTIAGGMGWYLIISTIF